VDTERYFGCFIGIPVTTRMWTQNDISVRSIYIPVATRMWTAKEFWFVLFTIQWPHACGLQKNFGLSYLQSSGHTHVDCKRILVCLIYDPVATHMWAVKEFWFVSFTIQWPHTCGLQKNLVCLIYNPCGLLMDCKRISASTLRAVLQLVIGCDKNAILVKQIILVLGYI